jgi:F0F1-type ATP synthase delta subunit
MTSSKLSRRKIAEYAADQLMANKTSVLDQLGAYLIESGRTKEAELVVRDIQTALLARGKAIVTAVAARSLSAEAKRDIEQFVRSHYEKVRDVELIEEIDKSVLGGVRITLPNAVLDSTAKTKLESLTI